MFKPKKYIAMIVTREYLGPDRYVFICSHASMGTWNQEDQVFIDRNGNEFYSMVDPRLLHSSIPYAYGSIIEKKSLPEFTDPNLSTMSAIREYEEQCKNVLFFVGKNKDGNYFCVSLPIPQIFSLADAPMLGMEEEEDQFHHERNADLVELQENIIKGEFSLEELKMIRENLAYEHDDLSQVLDTVELQIEADEQNVMEGTYRKVSPVKEKKKEPKFLMEEEKDTFAIRIDIEELFRKVTSTLIAQDEPTRRVIAEIARKELDVRKKKEGILLTGPTGVGKTELMRLIAKYLNKPFFKVDATQLTVPGYVGKDIEEVLWDLYVSCGKDIEKAESAIIFFDEIDKKGSRKKSDISGQGVLNVLLPFIEGTTYNASEDLKYMTNSIKIKTDNMIVILGGAYTDVYKNLAEKNGIGFLENVSTTPHYRQATTKDFIEKGMMTDEFMGRVTVIKLNDLDVEDIKRIMLESDESAIRIQQGIFSKLGVKLTFTDDYFTAVAKSAHEKKIGARGLNSVIDETTWVAFDDVYSHPKDYEEVILSEDTLEDPKVYQLILRKERE